MSGNENSRSSVVVKLVEYIGKFGGSHIDARDSKAGFTSMLSISNLPENYCPGHMVLLSLGVHVRLDFLNTFACSGLQWHVGTLPTAPDGVTPVADAIRLLSVAYPNVASFEKSHLSFFGSIPSVGVQSHGQKISDRHTGEFRVGYEMTGNE
jgi:hypothetical protein